MRLEFRLMGRNNLPQNLKKIFRNLLTNQKRCAIINTSNKERG